MFLLYGLSKLNSKSYSKTVMLYSQHLRRERLEVAGDKQVHFLHTVVFLTLFLWCFLFECFLDCSVVLV